jgi:glycerol-3-phosphate dehydrogenase
MKMGGKVTRGRQTAADAVFQCVELHHSKKQLCEKGLQLMNDAEFAVLISITYSSVLICRRGFMSDGFHEARLQLRYRVEMQARAARVRVRAAEGAKDY